MKYLHPAYDIQETSWWTQAHTAQQSSVKELLTSIDESSRKLKAQIATVDKTILAGFDRHFRSLYLLEAIVDKSQAATLDTVEGLLAAGSESKLARKVCNLDAATLFLFPTVFFPHMGHAFTPELAVDLHRLIGKDIFENAGSFRKKWASPSQEQYIYLAPHLIESHLKILFTETTAALRKSNSLLSQVKIVASFLTSFLHIHPFSNGNGRVARLLTSFLLSDHSIVPIPIAGTNSRFEIMLECLRESRLTLPFKPDGLARLLLENLDEINRRACLSLVA